MTGWRTPDGLRARMSVFRVLDPDVDTPDTKHADAAEAVWLQYWQDPIALRAAVEAARMQIQAESVRPGVRPSRGPVAWSGGGRFERPDGDCWVYVMVLDTVPGLSPPDLPGAPYIKVGRSNDVDRRAREFNAGLPPALGLAWRVVDAVLTASTAEADDLEQRLFGQLRDMGVTIGGEFVRADPAIVVGRLYDLA
ncbi:GIY-YIG nuclease family protein [Brevundimonas sp.]|uniref:GIY-YIG nuclease family protein n=1 Tax=Brevundimonas sp. TaxID=1871086 RepID=UPI003F70EF1C